MKERQREREKDREREREYERERDNERERDREAIEYRIILIGNQVNGKYFSSYFFITCNKCIFSIIYRENSLK